MQVVFHGWKNLNDPGKACPLAIVAMAEEVVPRLPKTDGRSTSLVCPETELS